MPELPEVETTVNGISPQVKGHTITDIKIHQDKCRLVPDRLLTEQVNTKINKVYRKAKYIILENDNGYIIIHLGMSGYLRVVPVTEQVLKHDHVEIILDNNTVLRYNDQRRFGGVKFIAKGKLEQDGLFKHLGPDALSDDFNAQYLYQAFQKRSTYVKNCLMDNKVVVGVGNIYCNESLFEVGINPFNSVKSVTFEQVEKLIVSIKAILKRSIAVGGTTLRDFVQPNGKPGYFVQELQVYGHEGKYLEQYNDYIIRYHFSGRSAFFCLAKQPLVGDAIFKYGDEFDQIRQQTIAKVQANHFTTKEIVQ